MKFPLMRNNILREDLDAVIAHLKQDDPILTNGANVRAFEAEWSKWLGVKHSVYVNSGASANLLTMAILKIRHPDGGEVIVPPLTWISDVASVMQNGFKPVFADIDPRTLGMDPAQILAKINDRTRAVFLTHVQGFDGLTDGLLDELKRRKIPLIEDVCESHGATHNGKKLGSFGWISNFSFYYAHHMSTIEGGMVCTDDPEVYQQLRMLRSHGMVREANDPAVQEAYRSGNPELNPDFIFAYPAYNVRNTEIGGIMGRSQLKRLDKIVKRRTENLLRFLKQIDPGKYRTDFKLEGSSNYAFNLVLKQRGRRSCRTPDAENARFGRRIPARQRGRRQPDPPALPEGRRSGWPSSRVSGNRAHPFLRLLYRQLPRPERWGSGRAVRDPEFGIRRQ